MNANQIHIGGEYAVAPYGKPNGNVFVAGAIRFKAFRTFGVQEPHNKRLTMYVEGFKLNTETGDILSTNYVQYRVRDVIEDWDEYEDCRDQHQVEADRAERERQERWQREREEREERDRQRRVQQQREGLERSKRRQCVQNGLRERSFPPHTINDYNDTITVSFKDLEAWLQTLTKVECETCHRDLILLPKGVV